MRFKIGLLALMATALACSPANKREKIQGGTEPERPVTQVQALDPAAALDAQWTLTNWSAGNSFLSLHTSQNSVFARSWDALNGGRVFLTADNGSTWAQVSAAETDIDILAIAGLSNTTLAGTWNGLYQSTTGGTTWTAFAPTGLPADIGINLLASTSTALFAATTGHIYKSSNNGNTWAETSSGIPTTARITSAVSSATAIFLGTDKNGVYASNNGGTSWAATNSGLSDSHISQLAILGTRLFAVTLNGVFVSTNSGTSWSADTSGLQKVNCLLAVNDLAFAGTDSSGAYLSSDSGATWTSFNNGLPAASRIWSLASTSDSVFAGTNTGVWRTPLVTTPNVAPTIAAPAAATPTPVTGTTANLSVLGADDGGEPNLSYTWATLGTPAAAVAFSVNGTNAAKATTVTFGAAGDYSLQVTVKDRQGLTVTSSVSVRVDQSLTSITLTPASATVAPLATQQFTATAWDQFTTAMVTQPSLIWSVSGGGACDSSGLFTAGDAAGGPYTVTASSGLISGTATVSIALPNAAPTVTTAAAATPNPVTGATAVLSVLGADDAGEPNLVYTWATSGTPPAAVTFSANGTNAAKSTTATFTKSGTYAVQVTLKDQGNLTATSSVAVTVNQTLTSIAVSPTSASINTSATQQFAATGSDQFATLLATQPSFAWTVSGGGTISSSGLFTAGTTAGGPYTVTAQSAAIKGTGSITVTPAIVYQVNCGGSASSPYTADQYYSGGTARTVSNSISLTGATSPAPQAVYQAERYGAVTYTFPNLTAGATYTVRLHFAELYWTATGKRKFNATLNNTTVLSSFDIYSAAGGQYKAIVREFTTTANTSGQIVLKLTTVTDNATIEGIQIIRK